MGHLVRRNAEFTQSLSSIPSKPKPPLRLENPDRTKYGKSKKADDMLNVLWDEVSAALKNKSYEKPWKDSIAKVNEVYKDELDAFTTVAYVALCFYTSSSVTGSPEDSVHFILNQALRNEDIEGWQNYLFFLVYGIRHLKQKKTSPSGSLYRGIPRDCGAYETIVSGSKVKFHGVTSTSLNKVEAERFGKGSYVIIHPNGGACPICDISLNSAEDEFIFEPMTVFDVKQNKRGVLILTECKEQTELLIDSDPLDCRTRRLAKTDLI